MIPVSAFSSGLIFKIAAFIIYCRSSYAYSRNQNEAGSYPPKEAGLVNNGYDGSVGDAPGFPKNGNWVVRYENFNKMQ